MSKNTDNEASEADIEAQLVELQSELEEAKKDMERQAALAKEYLDSAKRVQAEFDNYKKRVLREKDEYAKFANEKVIGQLLTIIDDFERAIASQCELSDLKEGIEQIHDNLMALLKNHGLKEIPADQFDPNYHEALAIGEGEDGKILEVYQKGYLLGPRVIRYSKVRVAKQKGEEND